MTTRTRKKKSYVVCLSNDGYAASLEPRGIYVALRDVEAERNGDSGIRGHHTELPMPAGASWHAEFRMVSPDPRPRPRRPRPSRPGSAPRAPPAWSTPHGIGGQAGRCMLPT